MRKKQARRVAVPKTQGYSEAGASLTRRSLKGFTPSSGSPKDDIDRNNTTLRQRSRMLYMASPVATAAINTNRTKVVGTGLTLRSTINCDVLGISPKDAKAWQRKTEAEFRLWADKPQNCDALALNNFGSLQQLSLKSWLLSGDVFALITRQAGTPLNPYTLRLHITEADRVRTRPTFRGGFGGATEGTVPDGEPGAGHKVHDGVEVDDRGRVVAYHICNRYPLELTSDPAEWTRVLAFGARTGLPNILHVMDSERPDQYRGVPYLAQIIEPLLQLRRFTESELMAALVQSFYTAFIITETNPAELPFNETGAGDVDGEEAPTDTISDDENEYEMGPGTVVHLKKGETVQFGNPNIPSASFEVFITTLCRMMGAALEIPADVLLKKFDASYSASRGALQEAWEAFKMRRKWFVDGFCQPVYEIWLAEAVALGRIKAPGFFDDPLLRDAWCGARWIGPVQGSLDPKKEAEADLLLINKGIKTHEQVTRERGGGDWQENMEQLAIENAMLAAAGGGQVKTTSPSGEEGEGAE